MKILTNGKIVSDGKVLCGYDIVIKDNKRQIIRSFKRTWQYGYR